VALNVSAALLASSLVACGGDNVTSGLDGGRRDADAVVDASVDAAVEAGTDSAVDAASDSSMDAWVLDADVNADGGSGVCRSYRDCDDEVYCNGVESCDPSSPVADPRGCVAGAPVVCADPLECVGAVCDEASRACAIAFDDAPSTGVTCVESTDEAASVIPTAGTGVPGSRGVPNWWTQDVAFDDPRWLGGYGYGQHSVKMTALVEHNGTQRALLLKWHIQNDTGFAGNGDRILAGFFDATTGVGTILSVSRDTTTTTRAGRVGADVMDISAFRRTGETGGWPGVVVPAGILADARIDASCDGALPPTCDEWVIRLRVPMTAAAGGIDLGEAFQMWFQADADHGGTRDRARFPVGAIVADVNALPPIFPEPAGATAPASAPWNRVRVAGAAVCSPAVGLAASDVEVNNALGTGTQIDIDGPNTFHVRARNNTPYTYDPNLIHAQLRISDWSSASCEATRWQTFPSENGGCEVARGPSPPPFVAPGGAFDLTCSWTLTAGQRCAYRPDLSPGCVPEPAPRHSAQAIAVDLFSSTSTAVAFSPDGAWNLFTFAPASDVAQP
jgi:hypothetical protein